MTRALEKYALCIVACAALIEFARFRRRQRQAAPRKEAIHTWEGEGGAVPKATPHEAD